MADRSSVRCREETLPTAACRVVAELPGRLAVTAALHSSRASLVWNAAAAGRSLYSVQLQDQHIDAMPTEALGRRLPPQTGLVQPWVQLLALKLAALLP